ncbi:MAG: MucR family transcriptional regulator [Alphaproteobacteria bacterium]
MTEQTSNDLTSSDLLRMTTEVVAAYVRSNTVATGDLPAVIGAVHQTLANLDGTGGGETEPQKPAVPVRRSVTPDYIVCLEDGKKLKMLKRHLRTTYGMTPDQYRAKWHLSPDYPMVAPNYAKRRSEFAKKIGLGRKGRGVAQAKSA